MSDPVRVELTLVNPYYWRTALHGTKEMLNTYALPHSLACARIKLPKPNEHRMLHVAQTSLYHLAKLSLS